MVGNKMRKCPSTDLQEWLPVREADDVPIPKKKKKNIAPGQEDQLVLERLGRTAQPVPDGLSLAAAASWATEVRHRFVGPRRDPEISKRACQELASRTAPAKGSPLWKGVSVHGGNFDVAQRPAIRKPPGISEKSPRQSHRCAGGAKVPCAVPRLPADPGTAGGGDLDISCRRTRG